MNKSNQEWIDLRKEKYIKDNKFTTKKMIVLYIILIFLTTLFFLISNCVEYWYVFTSIYFVGIVIQVSLYFDSVYKINEIAENYKIEVEKIEREFAENENTNI